MKRSKAGDECKAEVLSGPAELIQDFIENSALWSHAELPFKAKVMQGHQKAVLIAGPNASGKSFLATCALSWGSAHAGTKAMTVSIRERTGAGSNDFSGMRRAMMFGSEEKHSTGAVSASVVRRAFSSLEGWCNEGLKSVLLLDEPEMGLSEGYGFAMGELIGQEVLKLHSGAFGVMVVSHSRGLARGLQKGLGGIPSFIHTGEGLDFEAWCERQEQMSVGDLEALSDKDLASYRITHKLLDELGKT